MRGNRLGREASPYLQQHAENPVDWWPWGPEALAEARRRDVPVLLSVGYSACHWCHVMERESFSDEAMARRMNEAFVCVKVDREERPDVDQIYQLVVQLMGRSGGWPLTVFLAPDGRPFFGGTYFPPKDRYGVPGFSRVLEALSTAWRERRDEVVAQCAELAADVERAARTPGEGAPEAPLGPDLLARVSTPMLRRFDFTHGGFGTRPKFPNPMALEVLLRRGLLEDDRPAVDAVVRALDGMARGGIHDQLGGGFHRYATDERWLVPHFEKMLYDNALLLRLYAEAARATGEARFAEVAQGIAAYLAREMTRADGALFASADADSEGEEGRFFVWTPGELAQVLEGDALALRVATHVLGVTPEGNFEASGRTVLSEAVPLDEAATALGVPARDARLALHRAKERLLAARDARPRPFRDEKVIAVWNGLALGALADAGACLDDARLVAAAARGLDAVVAQLVRSGADGARETARHALGDRVVGRGFLDDHAALACAALDLYEATLEPRWVELAESLARTILARFRDAEGRLVMTPGDDPGLLCNPRDVFDGAVPSGTALACQALLRLGSLVGSPYDDAARAELEALAPAALAQPLGHAQTLCELDRLVNGATDVVVVGRRADDRTRALLRAAHGVWQPRRTLALVDPDDPATARACRALAEGKAAHDAPVAYVCRGRVCSAPVDDPTALAGLLRPG